MRRFSNDVSLAIYAICEFARNHSQSADINEEELYVLARDLGGPAYVRTIIEDMLDQKMIRQTSAGFDVIEYAVTPKAFMYVEKSLEEPASILNQALGEFSEKDTQSLGEELDEAWQPLPIDRDTPEYEKAVEATEEAVQVVEQDNGYAANEPEERNQIVDSLKAGLQWIKEGTPSLAQIRATLVTPLKFLASKFSGAAMGEAAKVAVAAIAKWLGLGS